MKDVYSQNTPGNRVRFFVKTGSMDVPLVTLGDNTYFPEIVVIAAREHRVDKMAGVVIDVVFQDDVSLETHR
ncbi:MAG: hypothetical protein M3Y82_03885, partial [Verrucomicrobiota bacterium]|nr:hypothetical protein [Verrucomicrobiota bacterium]